MVAFPKLPSEKQLRETRQFMQRLQAVRPEGRAQAQRIRDSIAETQAQAEWFASLPDEMSPEDLRKAKDWLVQFTQSASVNLGHVATMLDTLFGKS